MARNGRKIGNCYCHSFLLRLYIKFCLKSVDEEKYDEFATNYWSTMAK